MDVSQAVEVGDHIIFAGFANEDLIESFEIINKIDFSIDLKENPTREWHFSNEESSIGLNNIAFKAPNKSKGIIFKK